MSLNRNETSNDSPSPLWIGETTALWTRKAWQVGEYEGTRREDGSSRAASCRGAQWEQSAQDRSFVEHVGQRLVEHEVWRGLDVGGIEGRSLVE